MKNLDLKKKLRTRDGRDVRILCTDAAGLFPIVGLIINAPDDHEAQSWTLNGQVHWMGEWGSGDDLVNVTTRREAKLQVWQNRKNPDDIQFAVFDPRWANFDDGLWLDAGTIEVLVETPL